MRCVCDNSRFLLSCTIQAECVPSWSGKLTGSVYTYKLMGATAKAKANAAQGLPEMIKIATGKHFRENNSEKHYRNAAEELVLV